MLLDDDPILLEGLHTSALMLDHRIDRKRCYIRLHNDEAVYYRSLAGRERSWWKRLYFELEARRRNNLNIYLNRLQVFYDLQTGTGEICRKI